MPTSIYSVAFPQTKAENTKTKGENNHPLQVPNQKRNELLYLIKFISISCLTYRRLGLSISFFYGLITIGILCLLWLSLRIRIRNVDIRKWLLEKCSFLLWREQKDFHLRPVLCQDRNLLTLSLCNIWSSHILCHWQKTVQVGYMGLQFGYEMNWMIFVIYLFLVQSRISFFLFYFMH